MILLNEIVEVLNRPHLDVAPARMFSSQQPECAMTGDVPVERHFARHAW